MSDEGEVLLTELEIEMKRYITITKEWTGLHRFKIMSQWMGMLRMREMNDHLQAHLHSDKTEDDDGIRNDG